MEMMACGLSTCPLCRACWGRKSQSRGARKPQKSRSSRGHTHGMCCTCALSRSGRGSGNRGRVRGEREMEAELGEGRRQRWGETGCQVPSRAEGDGGRADGGSSGRGRQAGGKHTADLAIQESMGAPAPRSALITQTCPCSHSLGWEGVPTHVSAREPRVDPGFSQINCHTRPGSLGCQPCPPSRSHLSADSVGMIG